MANNSFYFPGVDKVFLTQRDGTADNPYLPLTQTSKVKYGKVELAEIPNFQQKVTVKDDAGVALIEVTSLEIGVNEFRVDYSTGIVKFNSVQEDKTFTFSFLGMGRVNFPASRITIDTDDNNEAELSIQQLLDAQGNIGNRLNNAQDAINGIETLISQNDVVKNEVFTSYKTTTDNQLAETMPGINILNFGAVNTLISPNVDSTSYIKNAIASGNQLWVPEGIFHVTEDLDVSRMKGLGVILNTSNGKKLVFDQIENKNQTLPTFGSNFSVGDNNAVLTNAQIDSELNYLNLIPNKPVLLVFHLTLDANKNLVCTQLDDPTGKGHSEAKVDYSYSKLKELGMKVWAIKIHTNHKYAVTDITDWTKYWQQYKQQCLRIANKYLGEGIEYVTVSNEYPAITSNQTYQYDLNSVVTSVKGLGYKVGFTYAGFSELDNCLHKQNLDLIGLNLYPSVSDKGINTPIYESVVAWDADVIKLSNYKIQYPNKKFIISEFGCTDFEGALLSPGKWDWVSGTPSTNGKTVSIFYEGAILALCDNEDIEGFFGWDFQSTFSPYKKEIPLNMLKTYFK